VVGHPVALRPDLKMVACARAVPTPMPLDMASPDLRHSCGGWGFGPRVVVATATTALKGVFTSFWATSWSHLVHAPPG
jgi:hypothetical protein